MKQKQKASLIGIGICAVVAGVLAWQSCFIIQEGEQAVITRFGRIVRTVRSAGLQVKTPFVDAVVRYSKKILSWDGDPQRLSTLEKQYIWVDTTARWVIDNPVRFYESVNTLTNAYGRLDDIIDSSVRTIIARHTLVESVRSSNDIRARKDTSSRETEGLDLSVTRDSREVIQEIQFGRQKLSDFMMALANQTIPEFGIKLIDIVIRQILYSDDLTQSVYARMIKERNQIAQAFRSEGEGRKAEWLGRLEREKRSILSTAFASAEKIKGEADAKAAAIYAAAYGGDPEFYRFWQSLESYPKTLPGLKKILTTDMDYFRYLYDPEGRR